MLLSELSLYEKARIIKFGCNEKVRARLENLGLKIGQVLRVERVSPLKSNLLVSCKSCAIAVSIDIAKVIGVQKC